MENNLAEPLSLLEIAEQAGRSRRQIERLFRQEMGRSPAPIIWKSGSIARVTCWCKARCRLSRWQSPAASSRLAFLQVLPELYNRSPQQERAERKLLTSTPSLNGAVM